MTDRTFTKTLTVANEAVVDTMFSTEDDATYGRKYFVTSFQGSGNLEVSDDETNWIDTGKAQNSAIELQDTLPRYIRINGEAGDKVIHLISL